MTEKCQNCPDAVLCWGKEHPVVCPAELEKSRESILAICSELEALQKSIASVQDHISSEFCTSAKRWDASACLYLSQANFTLKQIVGYIAVELCRLRELKLECRGQEKEVFRNVE